MIKNRLPKLHHYIPQVISRYFSNDGKNVYRYDKKTKKIKLLPIEKVAAIKHYYTFEEKDGTKNTYIENPFFSDMEGEYPKLIEKI